MHAWERELPKPPSSSLVVREAVFKHLSFYQARTLLQIYDHVLNDYGTVTTRTLYRALKVLLEDGKVKKVIDEDGDDLTGYVRVTGSMFDFEDQIWSKD